MLCKARAELNLEHSEHIKQKLFHSEQKYYVFGNKSGKLFPHLIKREQSECSIPSLRLPNGSQIYNLKLINNWFRDFIRHTMHHTTPHCRLTLNVTWINCHFPLLLRLIIYSSMPPLHQRRYGMLFHRCLQGDRWVWMAVLLSFTSNLGLSFSHCLACLWNFWKGIHNYILAFWKSSAWPHVLLV